MAAQTVPTSTGQQPTKTHDLESAANLERVTDFAEEKEITLDVGKVTIDLSILFFVCFGVV